MILFDRLDLFKIVSFEFASNSFQLLLLVCFNVEKFIPKLFLLFLQPQDVVLSFRRESLQSIDSVIHFIVLLVQLVTQFTDLLLVNFMRSHILTLHCLKFNLIL